MTVYEFERIRDGARVEAEFPFGAAPSLGETVELEGEPCRRVVSWQSSSPGPSVHFVSWQLPQWCPGALDYDRDPKSASYGQPRFRSKREVDEFVARHGGELAYGAMAPGAERRPQDQRRAMSDRIPTIVVEGRPKGARRRSGKGARPMQR